ncbi:hypothetical protein M0805_000867 [Coniferiporia weirii]|nr:hypothetical protein M0805_000867 [Coniferiporia weirii]
MVGVSVTVDPWQSIKGAPHAFHNYPGAGYFLPGDDEEIERLKFQHTLLKTAFEDRILLVPLGQESSYFVLDCGVGPAAWLVDAAAQLPKNSILHGIDINSSVLPLEHPPNVSFSVLSVTELPQEWAVAFPWALPELLREAGFVDIRIEMRAVPLGAWAGQFGIDVRNDLVGAFQAIKTAAFRSGPFGSLRSEEDYDELMDAMGKELDRTEGATCAS